MCQAFFGVLEIQGRDSSSGLHWDYISEQRQIQLQKYIHSMSHDNKFYVGKWNRGNGKRSVQMWGMRILHKVVRNVLLIRWGTWGKCKFIPYRNQRKNIPGGRRNKCKPFEVQLWIPFKYFQCCGATQHVTEVKSLPELWNSKAWIRCYI